MREALFYRKMKDHQVQCLLCPHLCKLEPERFGNCKTRVNKGGELITESYGILSAISSDPVEKKPLYHFHPGRSILSIGSFGCNMTCDFCQNCEISQIDQKIFARHASRDPADLVHKASLLGNNIGLAYTYNEPTVYFEYMIECAALLKERNLSNVMITNGYINSDPLEALLPYMDAFNVDLKSFRDQFYKKRSGARLQPVLETIRRIAGSDRHLELTFLIIPDYNDGDDEWEDMLNWISDYCGKDVILHVSRYHPSYKIDKPPTPLQTIKRFLDMASERIEYVYPGNTPQLDNHSYCPECGNLLIERLLYHAVIKGITPDGICSRCNYRIKGVFNSDQL